MKKVRLYDLGYPGCHELPDPDINKLTNRFQIQTIVIQKDSMPKSAPPPLPIPDHYFIKNPTVAKKPPTVTQKDSSDQITFDQIEDGRVTFSLRVRQGDSALTAQQSQKIKTTSKQVKIGDLNEILIPQQYSDDGRKFAPMSTSEMLMANGHGIIVPDDKDLAQRRGEFDRSKFIEHNPDETIYCTNSQFAPLKAADLLGEMKIVNYQ